VGAQALSNGNATVSGDTDGDGQADFAILVKGVGSPVDADFVL
jgi:hypothetical protein